MKIKPFKALRYNLSRFKDPSKVFCPPYDVINEAQRRAYQQADPYNMAHLILPQGTPGRSKYARAGEMFKEWVKRGIFARDNEEAVYFYRQTFMLDGRQHNRLGFIALLGLEGNNDVFPHEHTNLAPKEDRLQLLRNVRANLSPIFVLFEDEEKLMREIFYANSGKDKPVLAFSDRDGIFNELWRLQDKAALETLLNKIGEKNIFIADGHHRFEVAGIYLKEQKERNPGLEPDAGENFVMAYFTDTSADNLLILPIHRLIHKVDKVIAADPDKLLGKYFALKCASSLKEALELLGNTPEGRSAFIVYRDRKWTLAVLNRDSLTDGLIPAQNSREYRSLDVTVFNYVVLKHILGIDMLDHDKISYPHKIEEGINAVDANDAELFFILNPVKIGQMLKVAAKTEKMPPKSTFFYPKVLTGLAIHKF